MLNLPELILNELLDYKNSQLFFEWLIDPNQYHGIPK